MKDILIIIGIYAIGLFVLLSFFAAAKDDDHES
jgi:hypothetical protein